MEAGGAELKRKSNAFSESVSSEYKELKFEWKPELKYW